MASLRSPSLTDPEALIASRASVRRDWSNASRAYTKARRRGDYAAAYEIGRNADAAGLPIGRPAHVEEIMDTGNLRYARNLERAKPAESIQSHFSNLWKNAANDDERSSILETAHAQGAAISDAGRSWMEQRRAITRPPPSVGQKRGNMWGPSGPDGSNPPGPNQVWNDEWGGWIKGGEVNDPGFSRPGRTTDIDPGFTTPARTRDIDPGMTAPRGTQRPGPSTAPQGIPRMGPGEPSKYGWQGSERPQGTQIPVSEPSLPRGPMSQEEKIQNGLDHIRRYNQYMAEDITRRSALYHPMPGVGSGEMQEIDSARKQKTAELKKAYAEADSVAEQDYVLERAHMEGANELSPVGIQRVLRRRAMNEAQSETQRPARGGGPSPYALNGGLTMAELRKAVAEGRSTPSGAQRTGAVNGGSPDPSMRSRVESLINRNSPAAVGGVASTGISTSTDSITGAGRSIASGLRNLPQMASESAFAQKRLAAAEADAEDFAQKTFGMSNEQAIDPARVAAKYSEMTAGDNERSASLAKARQRQADYVAAGTPVEDSTKPTRSVFSPDLSDFKTSGGPALGLIQMTKNEREKAFSKMDPATEKRMRAVVDELFKKKRLTPSD